MFSLSPTPRPQMPTTLTASMVLSGCSSEEERSVRGGEVEMAEFSTRTIIFTTDAVGGTKSEDTAIVAIANAMDARVAKRGTNEATS